MIKNKNIQLTIVLLALSICVIFLDRGGKLETPAFLLRKIFSPAQYLSNSIVETVSSPVRFVQFVQSGENRISELEKRSLNLAKLENENEKLKNENSDLKKQLGVVTSRAHLLLAANVLGISRYMEIDSGLGDKVKPGQAVVYLDNYVGEIVKTNFGISLVRLVPDPESKVAAKTMSASGIVTGEFASGINLSRVAKSETISVGESVSTSGLGGKIPSDLIIGKIESLEPGSNELFQGAIITPLFNVKKLKNVYIIID